MKRLEENTIIIKEIAERTKCNSVRTYKEAVILQLGVIATMLTDISKSLAVIADKTESEEK